MSSVNSGGDFSLNRVAHFAVQVQSFSMILELFSQLDWRAFLFAMVIVELTPGPNMGWLAALSAQYGRRTGLMAVVGITLGLAVQVIAAATGLASLIAHFPVAYQIIRWAGVAFMIYLAWEAFSDASTASEGVSLSSKSFVRGFIANILNPKALIFYLAVVGQFARPEIGSMWGQILLLGGLHLFVALVVHIGIVFLGASFGSAFDKWRRSLLARLFFSRSLLAIAVWIGIST